MLMKLNQIESYYYEINLLWNIIRKLNLFIICALEYQLAMLLILY